MMTLRMVSIGLLMVLVNYTPGICQDFKPPPASTTTPDKLETHMGTLEFTDGVPTLETAQKVRDALDLTRALNVYNNSFRGASAYAIRQGFLNVGAEDNTVVIFSELMDSMVGKHVI